MKKGFKLALYINYFVYAILLNSVGIVMLKSQNNYGVSETTASTLELFKDLPIAVVSFLVASFLPRLGYKNSMLIALALVSVGLMQMYFGNSFVNAQIMFAIVGASFALIKVAVYASVGLLTENEAEHNSLMSSIEGVFMFGIALSYFLFPAFSITDQPDAWLRVYLLLTALVVLAFLFLSRTPNVATPQVEGGFIAELKSSFELIARRLVLVFVASAFLFVMIEQAFMTWMPTFNQQVLALSESNSIRVASVLALSLGLGRLLAGKLSERLHWSLVLSICLVLAMALVAIVLPRIMHTNVSEEALTVWGLPLIAFVFPMVGLFIAPVYPLLNSVVLSALPKALHSPMTGLIVVFSALGGTLGSRIIGILFERAGGDKAFYFTLLPMAALLAAVFLLKKMTRTTHGTH